MLGLVSPSHELQPPVWHAQPSLTLNEEIAPALRPRLPWIQIARDAPGFVTEAGHVWTPVGHRETVTSANLGGLLQHSNTRSAERYFRRLQQCGVACLRLMLEHCAEAGFVFEWPTGIFRLEAVRMWDQVFRLCERYGIRLLLSAFDVDGMWRRWDHHPYNRANGGPCASPEDVFTCPQAQSALLGRLAFASERWGRSGALFAWELWNDPAPGVSVPADFIANLSRHLREIECALHGRAHLQTAATRAPELSPFASSLDFVSLHSEAPASDCIQAAESMGGLVRRALHIAEQPIIVSQLGSIPLSDDAFRYQAWAHFASGGAGGGISALSGEAHSLTPAVHAAQSALAGFLSLLSWPRFRRRNLTGQLSLSKESFRGFACGDDSQAILWLLCADHAACGRPGGGQSVDVRVPSLGPGYYRVAAWHTREGRMCDSRPATCVDRQGLEFRTPPIAADLAFAIRKLPASLTR